MTLSRYYVIYDLLFCRCFLRVVVAVGKFHSLENFSQSQKVNFTNGNTGGPDPGSKHLYVIRKSEVRENRIYLNVTVLQVPRKD